MQRSQTWCWVRSQPAEDMPCPEHLSPRRSSSVLAYTPHTPSLCSPPEQHRHSLCSLPNKPPSSCRAGPQPGAPQALPISPFCQDWSQRHRNFNSTGGPGCPEPAWSKSPAMVAVSTDGFLSLRRSDQQLFHLLSSPSCPWDKSHKSAVPCSRGDLSSSPGQQGKGSGERTESAKI